MASRHPVRAAFAAAAIPLLAVLAFGNQWFTEEVRFDGSSALSRRMLNLVGGPFPWRFSPHSGPDAGLIWATELFGIVALVGLTFLIAWLIARAASQSGLFFGIWGATTLTSMVAFGLTTLASYDARYDGREIEPGINAFWYSFFHASDAALWGSGVGVVAGGAALLFAGGTVRRPVPAPVHTGWPAGNHPGAPGTWQPGPAPAPGAAPPPGSGYEQPVATWAPTATPVAGYQQPGAWPNTTATPPPAPAAGQWAAPPGLPPDAPSDAPTTVLPPVDASPAAGEDDPGGPPAAGDDSAAPPTEGADG